MHVIVILLHPSNFLRFFCDVKLKLNLNFSSYWSNSLSKCVQCPAPYSTSYAISGGANYNPFHCYYSPFTQSTTPNPNDWNIAYSYCNLLGVANFTMLSVENFYDVASANYFMINWYFFTH